MHALFAITPYLDSLNQLTRFLGYHILKPTQGSIALDLIEENVSFLPSEITLGNKLSSANWLAFLNGNFNKIQFDKDASVFLLTPMVQRGVEFEALEITHLRRGDLNRASGRLLNLPWLKGGNIDLIIGQHDPYALYKIAAALYRNRYRFDEYHNDAADYINLLQLLTGVDIGVKSEKGEITHHIETDFYTPSRENLLIYFAKNYEAFQWDLAQHRFVNSGLKVANVSSEAVYFEMLLSKTDSTAMNAFIKLTNCDPVKVSALTSVYYKANISANYALPPYRFLKQLTLLTKYCRENKIDFSGSADLQKRIFAFNEELSFQKRRRMEDAMINSLTPNELTALEYWSLVYESVSNLNYSSGRVLDTWYSKNWGKIISDKSQLSLFLKKTALFRNLSISGFCYTYLAKFNNGNAKTLAALKGLSSADEQIEQQKRLAIGIVQAPKALLPETQKYNGGNYDAEIKNLAKAFEATIKNAKDTTARNDSISKLFAKINYKQIDTAFCLVEHFNFKWAGEKYSFMDRDFGFFLEDFNSANVRKEFLSVFRSRSEYETYAYYLKKAGVDYHNPNQTLNYDKIYDILKYNVITAFVGGGGGWKLDNEVYAVIKLLELKFETHLGYPGKLCNSGNSNGCHASGRAKEWMAYLKAKGLLKTKHSEPYSFSYFDN